MQSGRLLLAALLRRCDASSAAAASEQGWALIRAAGSPPAPAAAAAAAATAGVSLRWAAAAGHSHAFTTSAVQAAATATAAAQTAAEQPPTAATATDPAADTAQQRQPRRRTSSKQPAAAPKVSFDELREQYQQQLSLRNIRDEDNLLLLCSRAHTPEQVTAALDLLRWDKMVRARQQRRYNHFSPRAMRSLLKAGRMARMGPSFAVQLLQEADELGMQVSLLGCEDVLDLCISKQDYWAAAEAWVYTRVYCADASRHQQPQPQQQDKQQQDKQQQQQADSGGQEAAGQETAGQPQQQQQQPQPQQRERDGPLGWASNTLMRLYAKGLAGWLRQGCVSPEHESYVKGQLSQLLQELNARGTGVPENVRAALSAEAVAAPVAEEAAVDGADAAEGQPAAEAKPE